MAQSSTQVECLCAAMLQRFGGIDGFADAMKNHIDAAMTRYPGSRAVGTLLQGIARMIEESDRALGEFEAAGREKIRQTPTEELESTVATYREKFLREGGTEEEFDALVAAADGDHS